MKENTQIAGYIAYYLKKGEPIETEGEMTEIPLTLEKKFIRPELKESYEKYFEGKNGIPTEDQFFEWLRQTEFEKCIMCKEITNVPINQHIDFRNFYIEGAGQLCETCYNNTYKIKKPSYE